MALITCADCGNPVSKSAATCPKCGKPLRKKTSAGTLLAALIFGPVVFFMIFNQETRNHLESTPTQRKPAVQRTAKQVADEKLAQDKENERCRQDLQCWANSAHAEATSACRAAVERRAKYQFRWEDGLLDSKFDHVMWADQATGDVTYSGSWVSMQNGFGAWQRMSYFCTFNPGTKALTNVEVRPLNE